MRAHMTMKRRSFLAGGSAFAAAGVASAPLPDYYSPYLAGIAQKIRALKNTPGVADGFFFFTDPHEPHLQGRLDLFLASGAGFLHDRERLPRGGDQRCRSDGLLLLCRRFRGCAGDDSP